ncbi:hypothetical protein [Romboutsia sp.]|uniref:hypothetical protein n=1 Tax=Romboutsia sp. TaxID=1965302 RepID=UPI002D175CB5|nr:hypothetical protein [Romboutsia sp.]HSQ89456.1 hypothetical protein [Romboutsia sp.]
MGRKNNNNKHRNKNTQSKQKRNNSNHNGNNGLVSEERKKNTVFCIMKIITQIVGIIAIGISDTHGQFLFLSSFVFMVPIVSDYFTLLLTTNKNEKQFKITAVATILNSLLALVFLLGAMNIVVLDLNNSKLILKYINGKTMFSSTYYFKEVPIYLLMFISSSSYIMEFTGILERKIVVPKKNYTIKEGAI